MEKISITLDVSKIDKTKILDRKYTDKAGVEHVAKEYKIDVVPLKAEKFVTEGSWGRMFKTHFVVQAQTKTEREAKAESIFIGDGFRFEKGENQSQTNTTINPEDVPW